MSERYVVRLDEVGVADRPLVGGKAAHLGELARLETVRVPTGFCVTTAAFRRAVTGIESFDDLLDRLAGLDPEDRQAVRDRSADLRRAIEDAEVPGPVTAAVTGAATGLGQHCAWAVRSSATAEDLPSASFAGQQDSFLNVVGPGPVLSHVRRCWASLFTGRAVAYRLRNGVDHRQVEMAVVVQQMVFADAAGVLFTADPVTSDRRVVTIEATLGLGEAVVAGTAEPDVYQVRDGRVVATEVATKRRAVRPAPGGGTREQAVAPEHRRQPVLSDAQAVRLAEVGRRIEAHFAAPQDVEWCVADGDVHIVQSRPITSLFPVPPAPDGAPRLYVSVGHQQMMTDPIRPLGLSMWQMTTPRSMAEAGGRLFVDVSGVLAAPATRAGLLEVLGRSDPLMGDALRSALGRGDLVPELPGQGPAAGTAAGPLAAASAQDPVEPDPAIVADLVDRGRTSLATLRNAVAGKSGADLLDVVAADIRELRAVLFDPLGLRVIMTAMRAAWWLDEHLERWLGERHAADPLTRSVPGDVTAQMGLDLLDVADAVRPHPDVVVFLQQVGDNQAFLKALRGVRGGQGAYHAIASFLEKHGMRCVGEIDITRPRWCERPATLVPVIVSNVESFEQGAGRRILAQGLEHAHRTEQDLLARLRTQPGGERWAGETKAMIDRLRTFVGYREYPKYHMVSRYLVYKQALLGLADELVRDRVLADREDIFYLRFEELREVVHTGRADHERIRRREEAHRSYTALRPPRVMTSDGEVLTGSYGRTDVPVGALVGLPVSAGTVEGRARVLSDMGAADLKPGDILVTTATDPSWTPVFVTIGGLVTEVGGRMTHGAVVAREYGLPAVVGVERATRLVRDGQRVRVNGTDGYVEILG